MDRPGRRNHFNYLNYRQIQIWVSGYALLSRDNQNVSEATHFDRVLGTEFRVLSTTNG